MNVTVGTASDFLHARGRPAGPARPPRDGRTHVPLDRIWLLAKWKVITEGRYTWNEHVVQHLWAV